MVKLFYLILLTVLAVSCAPEFEETPISLNPPLGLKLSIMFSAYNDETYLSGYQIFISTDSNEKFTNTIMFNSTNYLITSAGTNSNFNAINSFNLVTNNRDVNTPGSVIASSALSISYYNGNFIAERSLARRFTNLVPAYYDSTPFIENMVYYLCVKSYSLSTTNTSPPSNITNIVYMTN